MNTNVKNKSKGITLIALVITIIVLLILAGVTIATLTGENGILTKATQSKEETRYGTVKEARDLWFTEKEMANQVNGNPKTLDEILYELGPDGRKELTEEEIEQIKSTGKVIIANKEIDFTDENDIELVAKIVHTYSRRV